MHFLIYWMSMVSIRFMTLTFYEGMCCENVCTLAKNTLHFYDDYSDFSCNDIKLLYKHELKNLCRGAMNCYTYLQSEYSEGQRF